MGAPPLLAQSRLKSGGEGGPDFPGVAYRQYARALPDYLRGLARAAREKREMDLARVVSVQTARERQAWVRRTLLELIGGLPETSGLNARVVGSFDRPGYRLDRVIYESRPGMYVSANLYIPTGGHPPFPGILFQLGHSGNGKAWNSYQRACQGLARLGFLVLAFDPMGQGERIYYPDDTGLRTRLAGGSDEEHTLPGKQMLLAGSTCTQFQLWDAIRSLDYLASHSLVDATKLASTGQSGGATLTMLLSAVDDRLKAGAVFSGNTENVACRNFLPPGSTDDAEQNFIGAGPLGFDRWDLLYPFAPRPMLISVSDKDSFGTYSPNYVRDSWEEYQKLRRIYRLFSAQQLLSWADTPLPHGLSYDSRLQMYNWFTRHLKGSNEPVRQEPQVAPEPDAELWVSKSGNLSRSLGGETPFSLTRKRAASLHRQPNPVPLEQLLRLERLPQQTRAISLKKVPAQAGITIEALDVPSVAGVNLPAWLFRPRQDAAGTPLLLTLHPRGRNGAWGEDDIGQQLARNGFTVVAADVRGIGDLAPEYSSGAPDYARSHGSEEDYAWASLILGRPLAGQRATDILALAQGLRSDPSLAGRKIALAAFGAMTIPALFAAALDPHIDRVYLAGGLSSYRNIIETENHNHPFANFVPDVLEHTDLPELIAGLAPRRVVIAGPVNAAGRSHSTVEAGQIYAAALAKGHVVLIDRPEWSEGSLRRLCT
jgi:cephalosporin-C deacetylase-like acetyl esterase